MFSDRGPRLEAQYRFFASMAKEQAFVSSGVESPAFSADDEIEDTNEGTPSDAILQGIISPLFSLSDPDLPSRPVSSYDSAADINDMFGIVSGTQYLVRGANYMSDSVKEASMESGFNVVRAEYVFSSKLDAKDANRSWVAGCPGCFGCTAPPPGVKRICLVIELMSSSSMNIPKNSLVALCVYADRIQSIQDSDPAYSKAIQAALTPSVSQASKGDINEWNGRFKLIPVVKNGSIILRKLVGGKPAILGRKLTSIYHDHHDGALREIVWSVATDSLARRCCNLAIGKASSLVLDLSIVIEGKDASELPERVLFGVRLFRPGITNPRCVD